MSFVITTAVYMRVSTEDQKLDSQADELKRYCSGRSWTNLETYSDKLSGVKSRPAFERMLRNIRDGKVERVVCYKLDRIGRSLTQLAMFVDELANRNVPLICTSQGIDTTDSNPAGKFQLAVLMAVAEFERGIIRERVNAGLASAKTRGVKLGRPETQSDRVQEARKLRSQGMTLQAIAAHLSMPYTTVHKWTQIPL